MIVAVCVAAGASLVNDAGCVRCGGRCECARDVVVCVVCDVRWVWLRRWCDGDDSVVALSGTVYVVFAMCCVRDDDDDDDVTMADDRT